MGSFSSRRRWCFRPLSGSYISQYFISFLLQSTQGFPSPIGELHFSIISASRLPVCHRFRPLSGSYISQWYISLYATAQKRFPSPIGELHFSILSSLTDLFAVICFRPLSGSYISQYTTKNLILTNFCFRPLSGSYISQL